MFWLIIGIILFFLLLAVIFGYREITANLANRISELEEKADEEGDYIYDGEDTDSFIEEHQYNAQSELKEEAKLPETPAKKKDIEKEWEMPSFMKKNK